MTKFRQPLTISIHGEGIDIEAKIANDLQLAELLKRALKPLADASRGSGSRSRHRN